VLERDPDVAAYRDAVLETGVITVFTNTEAASYLRALRALGPLCILGLGVFFIDGGKGSLVAVPPFKEALTAAVAALRISGLTNAERRLRRAAARRGLRIGRSSV